MSPGEFVRVLLRRWYVLAVAMTLTAAGGHQVLRPAPSYLSSAVVVLKPPVTGNQPNQLANLQPPLAAVSYAVVRQLVSPAGRAESTRAGIDGAYRLLPRNSGTSATPRYVIPSVQVQAERATPGAADSAVRRVITLYTRHVRDLQTAQRVPVASRISVDLLVAPSSAAQSGTRSRGLAGVALLGTVGGVLAALWTDRYLSARRLRRRPAGPGPSRSTDEREPVAALSH